MQTYHPVSICPRGEKYGISSENLPLCQQTGKSYEGLLSRMGVVGVYIKRRARGRDRRGKVGDGG